MLAGFDSWGLSLKIRAVCGLLALVCCVGRPSLAANATYVLGSVSVDVDENLVVRKKYFAMPGSVLGGLDLAASPPTIGGHIGQPVRTISVSERMLRDDALGAVRSFIDRERPPIDRDEKLGLEKISYSYEPAPGDHDATSFGAALRPGNGSHWFLLSEKFHEVAGATLEINGDIFFAACSRSRLRDRTVTCDRTFYDGPLVYEYTLSDSDLADWRVLDQAIRDWVKANVVSRKR